METMDAWTTTHRTIHAHTHLAKEEHSARLVQLLVRVHQIEGQRAVLLHRQAAVVHPLLSGLSRRSSSAGRAIALLGVLLGPALVQLLPARGRGGGAGGLGVGEDGGGGLPGGLARRPGAAGRLPRAGALRRAAHPWSAWSALHARRAEVPMPGQATATLCKASGLHARRCSARPGSPTTRVPRCSSPKTCRQPEWMEAAVHKNRS